MDTFLDSLSLLEQNPIVKFQHWTDLIVSPLVLVYVFYWHNNLKKAFVFALLASASVYVPVHTLVFAVLYTLDRNVLKLAFQPFPYC